MSQQLSLPSVRTKASGRSVSPLHFLAAVAFGCLLLTLSGCGSEKGAEQVAKPPAVGVIQIERQKVNPFFEFVGKTRAAESVALRARVTGFLEERSFQEGNRVEKDEVLFRIEPQGYKATLAQADAELAAAQASLKRAEVDLERYRELVKQKNVSQQKVDEAEAEVLVQKAAVQTAEANIDKAQLNVDYTVIKAPISGRIGQAAFDVGNLIGPDSGVLATINQLDPIDVTFSIAETWYLELVKADVAERRKGHEDTGPTHVPLIKLPDGTMYEHKGSFDFFDNKVDESTGTVLIRAKFQNPDRILLPGQFVTLVVEKAAPVEAVLIPQAALLTDQGGSYVLLVNDKNRIETRRVETGQRFGPNVQIKEGLQPGERIVLSGIQKVRPGIEVDPQLTEATRDPMANVTSSSALEEPEAVKGAAGTEEKSDEAGSDSAGGR